MWKRNSGKQPTLAEEAKCSDWYSQFTPGHGRLAPGHLQPPRRTLLQAPASLAQSQAANSDIRGIEVTAVCVYVGPITQSVNANWHTGCSLHLKEKSAPLHTAYISSPGLTPFTKSPWTLETYVRTLPFLFPSLRNIPPKIPTRNKSRNLPIISFGICRATSQLTVCLVIDTAAGNKFLDAIILKVLLFTPGIN